MANWKDKGVVPDSDGESDGESDKVDPLPISQNGSEEHREFGETSVGVQLEPRISDISQTCVNDAPGVDNNDDHTVASTTPVFKDPRTVWKLGDDGLSTQSSIGTCPPLPSKDYEMPTRDDVSRSYVRLASPSSTFSTSNPIFQEAVNVELEASETTNIPPQDGESALQSLQQPEINRRVFRQRRAIQLKPYSVDDKLYRAKLKARGYVPTRIEEIAGAVDRSKAKAADNESQEQYSQDMDVDVADIDEDMDIDPLSLTVASSSQATTQAREEVMNMSGSENEFPDIDQLMYHQTQLPQPKDNRRRIKKYSSKSKRPRLNSAKPKLTNQQRKDGIDRIFEVPVSPPKTSSPFESANRTIRKRIPTSLSISSKEPTPSLAADDEFNLELPTPATSSVKPGPREVLLEDSDSDDPFASPAPPGASLDYSSTSPSSDESIEIRRVVKKIRGVLPASHARLDQHLNKAIIPREVRREILPSQKQALHSIKSLTNSERRSHSTTPSKINGNVFFSDESEEGETETPRPDFQSQISESLGSLLEQGRSGFAEEEDRVDAMLPSRKRQGQSLGRPLKKSRVQARSKNNIRQSRITEHLPRSKDFPPLKPSRVKHRRSRTSGNKSKSTKRIPPRLGILDVTDDHSHNNTEIPQFIRIAARTARTLKGLGRQSPARKIIRLATREDTADVQSVLQNWREGVIQPRDLRGQGGSSTSLPNHHADNSQTMSSLPIQPDSPHVSKVTHRNKSGRVLIVASRNKVLHNFARSHDGIKERSGEPSSRKIRAQGLNLTRVMARVEDGIGSRPAQLEASETNSSGLVPNESFQRTKRSLDSLYQTLRKGRDIHENLPLSRFIGRNEDTSSSGGNIVRKRKSLPRRMDVGAAEFRQPSEPLILEHLVPARQHTDGVDGKLLGLGKFGTKYPVQFDILPLHSGTHFHESTFIGSGRVAKAMPDMYSPNSKTPINLFLDEKEFQWGTWDENVSSEVGLCFDWILEQCSATAQPVLSQSPTHLMVSIVDYIQNHLQVRDAQQGAQFLSRITQVIEDFGTRLSAISTTKEQYDTRLMVEVSSRCAFLVLQILKVSRAKKDEVTTSYRLEEILTSIARTCIQLMVARGLGPVRKLFDNLQYLSFRESGINSSEFLAESWLIIIRALSTAKIPRKTFWDVANPELLVVNINKSRDAREMEKIWYSVFSLLPLCEFNELGIIVQDRRHTAAFDNWAVPQTMIKRLFALYSSDVRQSAGFNDYCRAVLSRCHCLMSQWGWWKCNGIIGSIFDFFAAQNLAHLRNEEVHKSPYFLDHLDLEQSLELDTEDRCFHILLKLVALYVIHMREVDGGKGVRNLITRILPNHNRQYPKDESIVERELAALRNHHDLFVTLYWSAPAPERPHLSLVQDLVAADRSHNAACQINLSAWRQLTRFILAPSMKSESFKPFAAWQAHFFTKLLEQYVEEEANTLKQAEDPRYKTVSASLLQNQIKLNRESTKVMIITSLENIGDAIMRAGTTSTLYDAFPAQCLMDLLAAMHISGLLHDTIEVIIDLLWRYTTRINEIHPYENIAYDQVEDDSQGSWEAGLQNVERDMLLSGIDGIIPKASSQLRRYYTEIATMAYPPNTAKTVCAKWALVVSTFADATTTRPFKLTDFLPNRSFTIGPTSHTLGASECGDGRLALASPGPLDVVFPEIAGLSANNDYWPLFLSHLLDHVSIAQLETAGFDIGLEWLLIIAYIYPRQQLDTSIISGLWSRLHDRGHSFLHYKSIESYEYKPDLKILHLSLTGMREWASTWLKVAISKMCQSVRLEQNAGSGDSHRNMKKRYGLVIRTLLFTIQQRLENLIDLPSGTNYSKEHQEYVRFVQPIIAHIRSNADTLQPLTTFFNQKSAYYWQDSDDPRLCVSIISSYCQKMERGQQFKWALFVFLTMEFKEAFGNASLEQHLNHVSQALRKNEPFANFMLQIYMPAVLISAFKKDEPRLTRSGTRTSWTCHIGWVLAAAYLPVIADHTRHLLDLGEQIGETTFSSLVILLKLIMDGIIYRSMLVHDNEGLHDDASNIQGMHPRNSGIIAVSCSFWLSIIQDLKLYYETTELSNTDFEDVQERFNTFGRLAVGEKGIREMSGEAGTTYFAGGEIWEGMNLGDIEKAMDTLTHSIKWDWTFPDMDSSMLHKTGCVSIGLQKVPLARVFGYTLQEILPRADLDYFGWEPI